MTFGGHFNFFIITGSFSISKSIFFLFSWIVFIPILVLTSNIKDYIIEGAVENSIEKLTLRSLNVLCLKPQIPSQMF